MSKSQRGQTLGSEQIARHPQGVGLLLFDLDDTIVQAGSFVSERVIQALEAAHNRGFVLSVASGRPLCSVNKRILTSGVMDYAVCANGSTVTCLSDESLLYHAAMPAEDCLWCIDRLSEFNPAWNAFFADKAFFEWKGASYMLTGRTGAIARASRYAGTRQSVIAKLANLAWRGCRYVWRTMTNRSHRQVRSVRPHIQKAACDIDKIGCTIPRAQDCAAAARLLREDGRFEVVAMGATELEITARGVSKGVGAKKLMDALGFEARDAYAFGDGGNDLPLANVVGCFVAMGNADPEVKEAADAVCLPVDEDGVAVWIENNLL